MYSKRMDLLNKRSKLLYYLKNFGELTFDEAVRITEYSKNTVSKYLKSFVAKGFVDHKLGKNDRTQNQKVYSITLHGINELQGLNANDLLSTTAQHDLLETLRKEEKIGESLYLQRKTELGLIESNFYDMMALQKEILNSGDIRAPIDKIRTEIAVQCCKMGIDFFKIESSFHLALAVIYIYFNTIENPQYHISQTKYLELYGLSDEYIEDLEIPEQILNKYNLTPLRFKEEYLKYKAKDFDVVKEFELLLKRSEFSDIEMEFSKFSSALRESDTSWTDAQIESLRQVLQLYLEIRREFDRKFKRALREIINGDYGVNRLRINNDIFFYHDRDSVGTAINQKIIDAINAEIFNHKIMGVKGIRPLSEIAREITEELSNKRIIYSDNDFKMMFEDHVLDLLYKKSIDLGLGSIVSMGIYDEMFKLLPAKQDGTELLKKSLTDQFFSKKLVDDMEWTNKLYNMIKGKRAMYRESEITDIEGFCPHCGYPALKKAKKCELCNRQIKENELITNINVAKERADTFRYMDPEKDTFKFIRCKICGSFIEKNWKVCPSCKTKLK